MIIVVISSSFFSRHRYRRRLWLLVVIVVVVIVIVCVVVVTVIFVIAIIVIVILSLYNEYYNRSIAYSCCLSGWSPVESCIQASSCGGCFQVSPRRHTDLTVWPPPWWRTTPSLSSLDVCPVDHHARDGPHGPQIYILWTLWFVCILKKIVICWKPGIIVSVGLRLLGRTRRHPNPALSRKTGF